MTTIQKSLLTYNVLQDAKEDLDFLFKENRFLRNLLKDKGIMKNKFLIFLVGFLAAFVILLIFYVFFVKLP